MLTRRTFLQSIMAALAVLFSGGLALRQVEEGAMPDVFRRQNRCAEDIMAGDFVGFNRDGKLVRWESSVEFRVIGVALCDIPDTRTLALDICPNRPHCSVIRTLT